MGSGTPAADHPWTAAFVQRLRELGRIEGRTIAIEYRWGDERGESYAAIAAELVRLKVDIRLITRRGNDWSDRFSARGSSITCI